MSEIKPGDQAWFKAFYVEWSDKTHHASQLDVDGCIPDHPALPVIASWLAEDEDNITRLIESVAFETILGSDIRYLEALTASLRNAMSIAALTDPSTRPETGGGG